MSISSSARMYTLHFTDGTFMTLANFSPNAPTYLGEYELIVPNLYFGTFLGETLSGTKYDYRGNKFEFNGDHLRINDSTDIYLTRGRGYINYIPERDTIAVSNVFGDTPPAFNEARLSLEGIAYGGITSGTSFSSFGAAMVRGEEIYDDGGIYTLENVVTRSTGQIFYGTTLFGGATSVRDFNSCIAHGGGTLSQEIHIDGLSDSMDDFDPVSPSLPSDDPYDPDDPVEPTGGGGAHDDSSDDIDIPTLPSLSAIDAGFITLYRPSTTELRALANYLWSSPLQVWDNVKKIVADPMDCILGLSIVPVNPSVGGAKEITVADVPTGVQSYPITSQYVEVPCGSVTISEYWRAYLDYEPYTKAEIYLPYIGTHPISIDDIMGKTITVVYHVDVLSGACTAYVKCGRSVLYTFIGQCASSIPIGGKDWTNVISGALTIATAIGSMVASGGSSAPMAGEAAGAEATAGTAEASMKKAAMIRTVGNSAATAVNVLKPSIGKSGSISGTGGLMSMQKPFIILTRPRQAVPDSQNHFMGYPSFMTASLGSLSGYTEMEHVHLEGIGGTDNEIAEIEQLLKGGVYL